MSAHQLAAQPMLPPFGPNDFTKTDPLADAGNSTPPLLQLWQIIVRWKWVILSITIAVIVAGLAYTLLQVPQYTSSTRIAISRDQKNATKLNGVEADNSGRDAEFYQTQYTLLEAKSLAARVARQLQLSSKPEFFIAHGVDADEANRLSGKGGLATSAIDRSKRDKLVQQFLLSGVTISPIRASSLVDIRYTSASAGLSAKISDAWAQQFIESTIDRRYASTADARKKLEGRLADLGAKLEETSRQAVNYAAEKGIIAISKSESDGKTQTSQTLASADLVALNEALASATADRISAASKAQSGRGTDSDAMGNGAASSLRQKRAELVAEYARMMVQYEPQYPAARALSEQIRALDLSIANEERRIRDGRSADYRAALQRENELRGRVDGLKRILNNQQRDGVQQSIYQLEADRTRQLYDSLLQSYKEIGVVGVGANNIAIVDLAEIPAGPSSPNLLFNLMISTLIGLGLAGIVTFSLEQIDEGLRDPTQVNRQLHLPLLGTIPEVDTERTLDLLLDQKSVLSEAFLSARSNLAFCTDHGVPRSFMVTSTRPAEGKSTTAFSLATMLGRTGKTVLLIDADMRSPSVNGFLGIDNKLGLSNFLAGENEWQQFISKTSIKGLSAMTAGQVPPSAAELLSSDRMIMLISQLLTHFDHIVVDSPPILGLADAPLLSRAVEGCVFVVEAEGVPIRGIRSALDRLNNVQARIFGVVLTKLKQRQSGYGYGYGYGDQQTEKTA